MNVPMNISKFRKVVTSSIFWIFFLLGGILLTYVLWSFIEPELIRNNLWPNVLVLEYGVSTSTILLGGIFFWLSAYKIGYFWNRSHCRKWGILGWVGSFLSILVSGCPACSITLASYLGLSTLFAWLPFLGYEVRILWILIMIGAIRYIWVNLETCELRVSRNDRSAWEF